MDLDSLSRVRLHADDADVALTEFVFGGLFAPPQVPRGISREQVSSFVLTNLTDEASPRAFAAVLALMRFYELAHITAEVVQRSPQRLDSPDDVRRAAYVTQIGVEFGTGDMPDRADRYLDRTVVASPHATRAFDALLAARVALAPRGTIDFLARRIETAVAAAEAAVTDEATLLEYDRLAAVANNDLPRAEATMARKAEILALPDAARVPALVDVYLGRADISDAGTEVWSGRLLRRAVMDGAGAPVLAALTAVVDPITSLDPLDDADRFVFERAAEAMAYLGRPPSPAHHALVRSIQTPGIHFLCDEPLRARRFNPQG